MTLECHTAYHSFDGEVEASTTPTICRLLDLYRHQLSAITQLAADQELRAVCILERRGEGRVPVLLRTNAQIDKYIAKAIVEAGHHAQNVELVVQPLCDAVRQRLNIGVDTIELYWRAGRMGRSCRVTIGGKKYTFSYHYSSAQIEMREDNLQSPVLASFDNASTAEQIARNVARM